MSIAPEQTSPSQQATPEASAAATPPSPRPAAPRVRDLTRWHIPFHYLPTVVVAVAAILMLVAGGTAGVFGGWLLAAALPIAIGAFLRSPWFALLPLVLWSGWLIATSDIPVNSSLSNTPTGLGLALATIGCGATLLAQRAIFPATEPGAWEASVGRLLPELDEDAPAPAEEPIDDHTIEPTLAEPIAATEEELAAAAAASEAQTGNEAPADADRAADEPSPAIAVVPAAKVGLLKAPTRPTSPPVTEAEAEAEAVAATDADTDTDADAPGATTDEDSDAIAELAAPAPTELPLDADPAPLDEGGHVTEFAAIRLDDADDAEYDEDADRDAEASAPADQRA